MRIPLATYGLREILLGTAVCLELAALCVWQLPPLAVAPGLGWVFLLAFFRDPERPCGGGPHELLSPADGVVADVEQVNPPAFLQGPAVRIGIFMSLLNVHVNRSPAAGTVRMVRYCPGRFHDARSPQAKTENEHNLVGLELADGRRVLVSQIAGVIARRIVCKVAPGHGIGRGERIGMVKFGSRVELYVPTSDHCTVRVRVGDRVKAGRDVLAAYKTPGPAER